MNRPTDPEVDARIVAMLETRQRRGNVDGVLASVSWGVRRTPQRTRPWLAWKLATQAQPRGIPAFLSIAVVLGILLALLVAAAVLVGGARRVVRIPPPRDPIAINIGSCESQTGSIPATGFLSPSVAAAPIATTNGLIAVVIGPLPAPAADASTLGGPDDAETQELDLVDPARGAIVGRVATFPASVGELPVGVSGLSWSPDGKTLAFSVVAGKTTQTPPGCGDIYLYSTDDGSVRAVTAEPIHRAALTPAWRPGQNWITYGLQGPATGHGDGEFHLIAQDLASGKQVALAATVSRPCAAPSQFTWDPLGNRVAYDDYGALEVKDVTNVSPPAVLPGLPASKLTCSVHSSSIAWSVDGTRAAAIATLPAGRDDPIAACCRLGLYAGPGAGPLAAFGPSLNQLGGAEGLFPFLVMTPSGDRVFVAAMAAPATDASQDATDIWSIAMPSGQFDEITPAEDRDAENMLVGMSPDGDQLLVSRGDGTDPPDYLITDLGGAVRGKLPPFTTAAAWQPSPIR